MFSDLAGGQSHQDSLRDDAPSRMACTLCRRRKLRCSRQLPCESCTRLGFDCVYEASKSQHALRKHRVQKPESPSARSPFGAPSGTSPETRPRPVASKASNQSLVNTEWSADQLRPEEMAELEQIYFRTVHESIPILHVFRYNTATVSEPRLRPPSYLRYIVCALGASVSPAYTSMHNALYRASRKTLEDTELNDHSTDSVPLARPQAWILIAIYELLQMHFHRWWMSTARAVRLSQMMGLHLVDGTRPSKKMLPVAKDWTEIEEQRRTFWMAFVMDRYAAFGYGAPMIIDERDVRTLLPVTEEAYQDCTETETMTLNQALDAKNMANLPPFAAGIVLTAEVGDKLKALQQNEMTNSGRLPPNSFWQKINWLDETLHYAFSVPPHLAASGYNHTPILTFLHMCAPSSTILLHQSAEEQASAHGITPSSLLESQALRLAAAEMVASTMRLANHIDVRLLHPFTGSCLFTAARVLMRSLTVRTDDNQQRSLKVLLDAMGQLQAVNPITGGYFKDLDTEFPGMRKAVYTHMHGPSGSSSHHLSGPDTPSTTSSYTPPPALSAPSDLPFVNGFILNQRPETTRADVLNPSPVASTQSSYPPVSAPHLSLGDSDGGSTSSRSVTHDSDSKARGGGGGSSTSAPGRHNPSSFYFGDQDFFNP